MRWSRPRGGTPIRRRYRVPACVLRMPSRTAGCCVWRGRMAADIGRMSHHGAERGLDPQLFALARLYVERTAAKGVDEEARSFEEKTRIGFQDPQHRVNLTHSAGTYTIVAEWMAKVRDAYAVGVAHADRLAETTCDCGECDQHGHSSVGQCLTSSHAFGCEFAIHHLQRSAPLDPREDTTSNPRR